jgi:predicted MPP superfamily phosphohydrolase
MPNFIVYLLLALHAYIGWRLVPAFAAWPWLGAVMAALLLASAILTATTAVLIRRIALNDWGDSLAWAGYLFLGLFSTLLLLTVLRDLVLIGSALLHALRPALPAWPGLRGTSAMAVVIVALLVTLTGLFQARRTPTVTRVDVPIANLPAALDGFTIAQVSDIHIGPTIKSDYLRSVVAEVNALDADMVAITGDMVDGPVERLIGEVAPIAGLTSRHGSFFVTGNHEYYHGASAWMAALAPLNMRVLANEHVVLDHAGATVVVGGITDFSAAQFEPTQASDPHAAIAGAPGHAGVRILLAHQPRSAEEAAKAGFDLQLSGHTHGGQFLPWGLFVPMQQPFVQGLDRLRNLWVYTNRGTGYWGPPNRFGVPSEITLLRLVPAA